MKTGSDLSFRLFYGTFRPRANNVVEVPDESVGDVNPRKDQEHVPGVQEHKHSDGGNDENKVEIAATGAYGFQARILDRADHQDAQGQDEDHDDICVIPGSELAVSDERDRGKVYDGGSQSGSRRYRKSDKILLIDLRGALHQYARPRRLEIKSGKPKRSAHYVHE